MTQLIGQSKTRLLYQNQMSVNAVAFIDEYFQPIFETLEQQTGLKSIPLKKFKKQLENKDLIKILDGKPTQEILDMLYDADLNNDKSVSFEEFKNMLCDPKNNLSKNEASFMVKLLRKTINSVSSDSQKTYHKIIKKTPNEIICTCPPPLFFISITFVEILCYLYYFFKSDFDAEKMQQLHTQSILIYNPKKREEVWRFFSYMFVHEGLFHLIANMLLQIIVGIPLELLHKSGSVASIYFSGVIAGSLGVSIIKPSYFLLGSSGGIYAIIAAYLAFCFLHWNEIKIAKLLIIAIFFGFLTEFILFFVDSYHLKLMNGFYCHLFGSIAGALVGLKVFSNHNAQSLTIFHYVIGNLGLIFFLLFLFLFIILNIFLYFLN